MAVQDLWFTSDREPTVRHGRGRRWRVKVAGYPSLSFDRKGEAQRYEARLKAGLVPRRGQLRRDAQPTVADLLAVWLDGKCGLSRNGFEAARYAADRAAQHWGAAFAHQVQTHEIQVWLAGVQLSASSRQKIAQALKGAFQIGIEQGALDRDPADGVRVPPERAREGRFLAVDELQALAAGAGGDAALVLLLGTTGMRVGEATGLDVADVDPARRRVRVRRSKTGVGRDVSVPASVLDLLDLERGDGEPLFRSPSGCRVMVGHWRARVFKPAAAAAGLSELRIHDLRHTAASLMIAAGADVKVVQRQLGHKTAAMTLDLYGHLWDRGLDDLGVRMEGVLARR